MSMQPEADKKITKLVDPNEVLTDYLDALLGEIETVALVETTHVQEVITEVVVPSVAAMPEISQPELDTQRSTELETEQESDLAEESTLADGEFQILLFHVAGITLAVPLNQLGGILEWNDEITLMPNSSPWFMGLLPERGEQIKIIDTGMLVVPSKFRLNHSKADMQKIILVGEDKWGLACDSVSEVITLQQDKVRWRGSNSKRPWLAGTVVDHMCALLDVEKFVELLSSEELEPAD